MTHYLVGLHHPTIGDNEIVELHSYKTDPPTSIVARVSDLKRFAYWKYGERWNFAHGERKHAIERGGAPQWKPVVDDAQPEQAKSPYIDDSDPNNPIFRAQVGTHEYAVSMQYVPEDRQQKLASLLASHLHAAYTNGKKEARAEIQAAIRNALML